MITHAYILRENTPIFFSGEKVLGYMNIFELSKYPKDSTIIFALPSRLRRRLVLGRKAYNIHTGVAHEVSAKVYLWPSQLPEPLVDKSIALGVLMKTLKRRGVFAPILPLANFTKEEAEIIDSFIKKLRIKEQSIKNLLKLIEEIGIKVIKVNYMANKLAIKLNDGANEYDVVVDERGRVIETNICIALENLHLLELVLLTRGREVYVYEPII